MTNGRERGHAGRSDAPIPSPTIRLRRPVADRLDRATGRVALVVAPGGYGKTSQVALWARCQSRPVAWVDLEPGHNDPGRLLDAIVGALASVADVDQGALRSVAGSSHAVTTVVAPELGRLVRRCHTPFVLVLDDTQLVEDRACGDLIEALVGNVPASATVVLAGRAVPPLSFARLRVQDGVVDVTMDELSLDTDDVRELLHTFGVEPDDEELDELVGITEGWPVGIRVAALALVGPGREGDTGLADALRSDPRLVREYVHEEWLRGLPADDADFLRRASVLDRLSGPACDHLLDRGDSGERLERLHADRGLVVALDRRGDTFRINQLVRDALVVELEHVDRDAARSLHCRASEWFERQSDIDRALEHAFAADDLALAERLVCEYGQVYNTSGRAATVKRWLECFPTAHVVASPGLCLMAGVAAVGLGDGDGAIAWARFGADASARRAAAGEDRDDRALCHPELLAFRAMIATQPIADGLADTEEALRELPRGVWRVAAGMMHGALSYASGDDDQAVASLSEAAADADVIGARTAEAICRAHLAIVLGERDQWSRALTLVRTARQLLRDHDLEDRPALALVTAVSALAEAMDGDPELARTEIQQTRGQLTFLQAVSGWQHVQARIAVARASILLGDRVAAHTFLDEAESFLREQPDSLRAKAQVAALAEQLRSARDVLPCGPSALTTAELRVLHYLPTNLTHEEIARRLYVSRNTAKSHAASIYRKLGASSRSEAVELGRAAGLLPVDESSAVTAR